MTYYPKAKTYCALVVSFGREKKEAKLHRLEKRYFFSIDRGTSCKYQLRMSACVRF
jgi:hypothetical protein